MKLRLFRRSSRGLTLVEMLIAITINLLGAVAIVSTLILTSRMTAQAYYLNKATMEARLVIDMLTSDARMAMTLESSFGTFTADANTLILKLPAIDAEGIPVDPESKFDRIVYHRSPSAADRLARTIVADASSARKSETRTVAESVTPGIYAVQPDPIGQYIIYYQFTSLQKWAGKTTQVPVGGSVQLRNHS